MAQTDASAQRFCGRIRMSPISYRRVGFRRDRPMTSPTPPPDLDPVALEAAARKSYEQKGKRKGINYIGWGEEPDSIKAEWIFDVKEAITASSPPPPTRGGGGGGPCRRGAGAAVPPL